MASSCLGSCDAFFLRPSAPYKDLSSEPFPAVCRESSVHDHVILPVSEAVSLTFAPVFVIACLIA